jgi:hypothetical protein
MDAQYLKKNVNDALAEALTSMTVALPEDGVEYVGNYLLQYVGRRQVQQKVEDNFKEIDAKAVAEAERDAAAAVIAEEKQSAADSRQQELDNFVTGLSAAGPSKQAAMDAATAFLAEYLSVPAVYVALRKVEGENEFLNYMSANPSQTHVVGKKLKKATEEGEGDELPPRQGCSFEAFKLPVVEEPEEPAEGEEAPPPPPPPVAQPLIVDNVMRDSRIQFFGIPKLGSFVAVPLLYDSCDHAAGCVKAEAAPAAGEEGEEGAAPAAVSEGDSPYAKSNIPLSLLLVSDTIGDFRRFSKRDIEILRRVGEAMLLRLQALEDDMFQAQVEFITKSAAGAGPVAALIAALAEEETAGK